MVKNRFNYPVAVQNVSGEYAMIKAIAMRGWIDEEEWKVRSIASIRRAGVMTKSSLTLCSMLPNISDATII